MTKKDKKRVDTRVKALIVLKNIKQADIAKKLDVTPSIISRVISGKKKSRRIRKAIADALGMRVDELWSNGQRAA